MMKDTVEAQSLTMKLFVLFALLCAVQAISAKPMPNNGELVPSSAFQSNIVAWAELLPPANSALC